MFREFSFSVVPGNASAETVLSAGNEAQFMQWLNALPRQAMLATQANNRGLNVSMSGDLVSQSGEVVATANAVLKEALGSLPQTPEAPAAFVEAVLSGSPKRAGASPVLLPSGPESPRRSKSSPRGEKERERSSSRGSHGSHERGEERSRSPKDKKRSKDSKEKRERSNSPSGSRSARKEGGRSSSRSASPAPAPLTGTASTWSAAPTASLPPPPPLPPPTSLPPPPPLPAELAKAGSFFGAPAPATEETETEGASGTPAPVVSSTSASSSSGTGAGSGTSRSATGAAPQGAPQDLPKRPKNMEIDPALRLGAPPVTTSSTGGSIATGARVRGTVTSDMDMPPAPPERGASSRPPGAPAPASSGGAPTSSLSSSGVGLVSGVIGVASKNHFIPAAAMQGRGMEMPKAKFKAWAEAGGTPSALVEAAPDYAVHGGGSGTSATISQLLSPARAYPHGNAAGQKGDYEGGQAGVPTSMGEIAGQYSRMATLADDDNESTVGSIAGVPTSMTGTHPLDTTSAGNAPGQAGGPRVTFADQPTILSAAAPSPAPVQSTPLGPVGLSFTSASPAYSYPQMRGGSGGQGASASVPPNVIAALYQRAPSTASAVPGGLGPSSSTPAPRPGALQPRRLGEVAAPLPRSSSSGLPVSRFATAVMPADRTPEKERASTAVHEGGAAPVNPSLEATAQAVQAATIAAAAAGHQVDSILKGHSPPSKTAAIAAALAATGTQVARPGPAMPPMPGISTPGGGGGRPPSRAGEGDDTPGAGEGYNFGDEDGGDARSIDQGALEALDSVDIDNRSVATGHTGSIDTWAFYYGPEADKERDRRGGQGVGGGGLEDGGRSERTRHTNGGTPLPVLPPAPKLVPVRDVKRAFDSCTAYTEGLLPLGKLPELSASLGMTLQESWAGDVTLLRELGLDLGQPGGISHALMHAQLSRNDFLSWWKKAAVARVKAHEADTLRVAALAAVRAREAIPDGAGVSARERRQRKRAGGDGGASWESSTVHTTTDRDTVTTFGDRDTEFDRESIVSLGRLAQRAAMYKAMGVQVGPDGKPMAPPASTGKNPSAADMIMADDALAAVEANLEPIAASAADMLKELEDSLTALAIAQNGGPAAAAGIDEYSARVIKGSTSASPVPLHEASQQEQHMDDNTSRGKENVPLPASSKEVSAQVPAHASVHDTSVSSMDASLVGAASRGGTSGGGNWLNKYRGGPLPQPQASAVTTSTPVKAGRAPSSPKSASSASSATSVRSTGQALSPGRIPAPLELPTGLQGVIAHAALAAVAASLGGAVDEATGIAPIAYEAPHLLPLPQALPPHFAVLADTKGSAAAVKQGAWIPAGLGLDFKFDEMLLTAEAARFSGMSVEEQEARAIAAELAVAPGPDGRPGVPLSMGAVSGQGVAVDLASTVSSILTAEIGEEEWNERFQRLQEKPEWRYAAAATKAVGTAAFLGRFASVASEGARLIVEEIGLPMQDRSLQPMSEDGTEPVWFYKGILLRVAGALPGSHSEERTLVQLVAGERAVERKVAGHTLRGLSLVMDTGAVVYKDWAASAGTPDARRAAGKRRPPPLCAPLTCLVDYCGVRLYAMAIPPVEEDNTLVIGRAGPEWDSPYLQRSPLLASMLRRVGRSLHLKPHAVEAVTFASGPQESSEDPSTLATRTLVLPLAVDVAGHAGTDKRLYLLNTARMLPADAPHVAAAAASASGYRGLVGGGAASLMGDSSLIACLLRPEFLRSYEKPLSADAYRSVPAGVNAAAEGSLVIGAPPDAAGNDMDTASASGKLLTTIIPAFVAAMEAGAVKIAGLGAEHGLQAGKGLLSPLPGLSTAALPGTVYDSAAFTTALHGAGINARHLGRVAAVCSLPHTREFVEMEMIARCAKILLEKEQRAIVAGMGSGGEGDHGHVSVNAQAHSLLVRGAVAQKVCEVFSLALGASEASATWWKTVLSPLITAKFGYELQLNVVAGSGVSDGSAVAGNTTGSTSTTQYPCPVHKYSLLRAMEHHCRVSFGAPVPLLPSSIIVPRLSPTPGCTSVQAVHAAHSEAAELLAHPNILSPPSGKGAVLSSTEKELFTSVPALAPLMSFAGPGLSSSMAKSTDTIVMTFVGIPMTNKLPFDLGTAQPFKPELLKSVRPASTCLRSVLAGRALETTALALSAEEFLAKGDLLHALHALQLRLALLQGLSAAGDAQVDNATEAADVLLSIARLQLALGQYDAVGSTSLAVMVRVGGFHPCTARALALKAQAVLLQGGGSRVSGAEAAGLFAAAMTTARAALGHSHPLLCELTAGMACGLAAAGRHAAAAGMLEGAAGIAAKAMGRYNPSVLSFTVAAGHACRLAASAAFTVAKAKGEETALGRLARLHGNAIAARAASLYEKTLGLLEGQSQAGSSSLQLGDLLLLSNCSMESGGVIPIKPSADAAARAHQAAVANTHAVTADALASCARLSSALTSAKTALNLRVSLVVAAQSELEDKAASLSVVQSLQQVAALQERMEQFTEALSTLDELVSCVKGLQLRGVISLSTEGLLAILRCLSRHVARLAARAMSLPDKQALQREAVSFYKSRGPAHAMALVYAIARLTEGAAGAFAAASGPEAEEGKSHAAQPVPGSTWIRGFLASTVQQVHGGAFAALQSAPAGSFYSPAGNDSVRIPEPPAADVLVALCMLLGEGNTVVPAGQAQGGDLCTAAGVSMSSPIRPVEQGEGPQQSAREALGAGSATVTDAFLDLAGVAAGVPTGVIQPTFGSPRSLADALYL